MPLTTRRCAITRSGALITVYSRTAFELCCREQDLQRQVALAKSQLRDLRMSHDSNQAKLLDHTQRQGTSYAQHTPVISQTYTCRPRGRGEAGRTGYDGC